METPIKSSTATKKLLYYIDSAIRQGLSFNRMAMESWSAESRMQFQSRSDRAYQRAENYQQMAPELAWGNFHPCGVCVQCGFYLQGEKIGWISTGPLGLYGVFSYTFHKDQSQAVMEQFRGTVDEIKIQMEAAYKAFTAEYHVSYIAIPSNA